MRLTGHIRGVADHRDVPFVAGGLPLIGAADAIDLRKYCGPIRNQLANDCCGHATASAAFATAAALGTHIDEASPLWLYANARLLDVGPGVELHDDGSRLRQMFKSMSGRAILDSRGMTSGLGLIREADYPEVLEVVNVVPPDDLYREGENATIKSYSRVPDGDIDGLIEALRRDRCPTLAFVADEDFENVGGTVYHDAGGAVLGGHAVLIVGYSADSHAFLIRNSWGTEWGVGGYCWMDQGFVANHTFDHWVIEVTPERLAA